VALSNLGVIRYQQNRLDDARTIFAPGRRRRAQRQQYALAARRGLFRKGAIEDAYAELNRAVAIDPHNARRTTISASCSVKKAGALPGELEIRRAIEINPQYPDAHFNLAVIYAKQRNPKIELAKYHYRKALDLGAKPDPDLESALEETFPRSRPQARTDTTKP